MAGIRGIFADTRPLRTPAYRRLFTAQIVTVVGAQLSIVAVPQQIYEITGSSAYVGLAGLVALVPLIVFGLWGGALADSIDRRTLLAIATTGLIVTTFGLFLQALLDNENVWIVLALLAVQQSFFSIGQPTRTAILPKLLPGHLLPAAAALNTTVLSFGAVAGPVLAGALIPILGLDMLYLIDAVAMFATLWAVFGLPALPPESAAKVPGLRSVIDGFAYLATQRVLLASYVVDLVAMVFGMARALFPQIAHEHFGDPSTGGVALGLLYASMAAGALAGGVFSGWVSRVQRHGATVLWAVAAWGLAVVAFGVVVALARPANTLASCSRSPSPALRSAAPPTLSPPRSARPSCSPPRTRTCAGASRPRSTSSSPAARAWATGRTATRAPCSARPRPSSAAACSCSPAPPPRP